MMTHLSARILVLALPTFGLAACFAPSGTTKTVLQPEAVQINAHLACHAERGINKPEAVEVIRLADGGSVVTTLNVAGISKAQAQSINQCAQSKLNGRSTTRSTGKVKSSRATVQRGCQTGGGVLQGGVAICPYN